MKNEAAILAYDATRQAITAKLNEIDKLTDLSSCADDIDFGHVGDLAYINNQLAQLLVFLKDEEE